MLLSKSVALSILVTMGVQGLVIPSVGDVIDVFAVEKVQNKLGSNIEVSIPAEKSPGRNGKPIDSLPQTSAPIINLPVNRDIIPHKYIVVLNDDVSSEEILMHQILVGQEHAKSVGEMTADDDFVKTTRENNVAGGIMESFTINNSLTGYFGYFSGSTLDVIRRSPIVKFVEKDSIVRASEFEVEKGAPWGLARVSHRQPLSLNSFNQYLYDNDAGEGVTAYVIDTGINVDHKEFGSRAIWGATIPTDDFDQDGNGHGTHCAGTIASESYGVAKKANVVAVKVLLTNGSGSMSDVVKGVEFAAKSHQEASKLNKKGFKGSTANMSLGGGKSPALDMAVNAAVKLGLHFSVAAGNENQDACNTSPASAENAITVGASTISDSRAYFSNYGKCVDIFAPGLNILSTYIGSGSATATLSGTSMASPHICGLLSYFLSLVPSNDSEFAVNGVSPSQLKKNLINYGSKGLLSDIPDDGTPNILAFNGGGQNLTEFWDIEKSREGAENVGDRLKVLETKVKDAFHKVEYDITKFMDSFEGLAKK